jgi:hypothetical protein
MKRITKETKAIADAHIAAKKAGKFDNPASTTKEEVIAALRAGKTFSEVMRQIEIRFCSVTSLIMASALDHETQAYRNQVYKGFKTILQP